MLKPNVLPLLVIEEDRSCVVSVSGNPLHMMTSSTNKLSCGTAIQPWTLEAPAGQHIDVSLVEFSSQRRHPQNTNMCRSRGQIIDKSNRQTISICQVGQQRTTTVYRSSSNVIQVRFELDNKRSEDFATCLFRFVGKLNFI